MRIFAVLSFIAVAFLLVGSAAAADIDANDTQAISAGAQNDLNTIGANASTYSELADEIGSGGNVTLKHDYYAYDSGDSIEITQNDSIIDGNGAIIDMLGADVRAFTVNASGITIKDLTIKNARFNGDGAAIHFNGCGALKNCSFVNNTAAGEDIYGDVVYHDGGAVCFEDAGRLTNCNFTNNRVTGDDGCGGAAYFLSEGNVTNCNFTNNRATGTDGCGGAVYFSDDGKVTNCNFTNCLDKFDYALYGNNIRAKNSRFSNSKEDAIYNSYSKVKLGIEFFDEYHMYGENNFFGFMVPNDIEKNIRVAIDGKTYDPEGPINTMAPEPWVWRGDYTKDGYYVRFDDLRPGNHKVVISYPGDSKYLSGSFSWTITVHGLTEASNLKATYTDRSYYCITVHDEYGKLAKRVDVVVKINGKKFKTIKTDSKGIAKFKVTQAPGTYKVQATALGNAVTRTLTVKHLLTLKTVTVKKSAKKLTLKATLAKINGKYLKNKKITFKFNGKKYTAKTDKKGVAKVTVKSSLIKKLKAGKKVTYQATYLKDTVKKTVKVQK